MIFKNPMGIDGTFGSNAPSNDNAQIQQPGYHSQPLSHQQDTSKPMDTQIRQPFVPGLVENSIDDTNQGPSTAPIGPPAQIRHAPQLAPSAVQPSISPANAFFHQQLHELSPAVTHGNYSSGLGGSSAGFLYQNPAYQPPHAGNVPPVPPIMPQVPAITGPVSQVWLDVHPLCTFPLNCSLRLSLAIFILESRPWDIPLRAYPRTAAASVHKCTFITAGTCPTGPMCR